MVATPARTSVAETRKHPEVDSRENLVGDFRTLSSLVFLYVIPLEIVVFLIPY